MSVVLEFINLLVRIDAIDVSYAGGWASFLKDHEDEIGRRAWYDDHLFRTGAMNSDDMRDLVNSFESSGFQLARFEGTRRVEWTEGCVVEPIFGPSLPCRWLAFTEYRRAAYLRGKSPGRVMTRYDFSKSDGADQGSLSL